jgi:phosphoribosyl 1,2-cyclic phosphodiesterase
VRLTFLGTGAAGGTPGRGRSRRRESSLLIEGDRATLLIDAPSQLEEQLPAATVIDAVALTHAHRDAAGGLPALERRLGRRGDARIRVLAAPEAIALMYERHPRLSSLRRYRTFAWRVSDGRSTLVYASDVAAIEPPLAALARTAQLLVIDGAMWRRTLFSHLTIDRELPALCRWPVERILLTQIGRSAPPHEQLERAVAAICPKAGPAWDGMTLDLRGPS